MLLHGHKGVAAVALPPDDAKKGPVWCALKRSGIPQTTDSLGQNNQNRLFGLRQLILTEHDLA